jgi:hypothetical protein
MGALGTNILTQWNPTRGSTQIQLVPELAFIDFGAIFLSQTPKCFHAILLNPFRVLDGNVHLPRVRCALPSALEFNAFGIKESGI